MIDLIDLLARRQGVIRSYDIDAAVALIQETHAGTGTGRYGPEQLQPIRPLLRDHRQRAVVTGSDDALALFVDTHAIQNVANARPGSDLAGGRIDAEHQRLVVDAGADDALRRRLPAGLGNVAADRPARGFLERLR